MNFFLAMKPPTVTHQEKKIVVVNGKPRVYEDARLRNARKKFMAFLAPHKPDAPCEGAVSLLTVWYFPTKNKKLRGKYRITPPDTENMLKLPKDCMTKLGYWIDDAQVARETTIKYWASDDFPPGIFVQYRELDC